jgi:hypothetical protein
MDMDRCLWYLIFHMPLCEEEEEKEEEEFFLGLCILCGKFHSS